jgi:glycosyltransferase involved in cell wall biosynthesis
MRVVYLNPIAQLGGAERSLIDFWAALKPFIGHFDFHLVCGENGPLVTEAERHGVTCHVLAPPTALSRHGDSGAAMSGGSTLAAATRIAALSWPALGYAKRLRRLLCSLQPALLHSNGLRYHLLTPFARPAGVPCIWHIRDFITQRPLACRLLRVARRAANVAVANSHATAADARLVLLRVPVQTIYDAIDVDLFTPGPASPARLDHIAGLETAAPSTVRIGLVATYARWKGHDLFLQAAARLAREALPVPLRFYIVGGPIYQTQGSQFSLVELRQMAANLGCPPIGFVPFQDPPVDIYRSLDVVVHASTRPEPFGRVIAEAMACGRAVVASLAGGVPEVIRSGIDALGFEPNDVTGLARAIVRLAGDPQLRQALGAQAHAAASRFSPLSTGRPLFELYQNLANGGPSDCIGGRKRR